MTLTTHGTETTAEQRALLATLVALRGDVMAEGDKLLSRGRDLIQRQEYLQSARNLACYLALRRRDLRTLQTALMRWGLSSLGRSESRVVPTLDAVITSLAAMVGCMTSMCQAIRQKSASFMAHMRSPARRTRSSAQASTGGIPVSW